MKNHQVYIKIHPFVYLNCDYICYLDLGLLKQSDYRNSKELHFNMQFKLSQGYS